MRTTLDIAEDVLLAAKSLAKLDHKSAGQVISELARKALQSGPASRAGNEEFLGFRPMPSRGVVVSSELIEQLRESEGL